MKIFFIFLLVINLLIAGWQYMKPAQNSTAMLPLPADLKSLQLLNELKLSAKETKLVAAKVEDDLPKVDMPRDNLSRDNLSEDEAVIVVDENNIQRQCFTLGPFKDENIMQQVRAVLAESVVDVEVRKREENEIHRYWVYLPSQPSHAGAIQLGEELAGRNVTDYYVVRSGDKKNGISLGHYKEKLYADRRIAQLRKLDFEPRLEVIYRNYSIYWLDYESKPGVPDESDETMGLLSEGVAKLDRECE